MQFHKNPYRWMPRRKKIKPIKIELLGRAKRIKEKPTRAEKWARQLLDVTYLGEKFESQVIQGYYICDFLSQEYKIVIEIDGKYHYKSPSQTFYDEKRDTYLTERGFFVLRIPNSLVLDSPQAFLALVKKSIGGHKALKRRNQQANIYRKRTGCAKR
jgi:very-short-patch-repair endonuclease